MSNPTDSPVVNSGCPLPDIGCAWQKGLTTSLGEDEEGEGEQRVESVGKMFNGTIMECQLQWSWPVGGTYKPIGLALILTCSANMAVFGQGVLRRKELQELSLGEAGLLPDGRRQSSTCLWAQWEEDCRIGCMIALACSLMSSCLLCVMRHAMEHVEWNMSSDKRRMISSR